MIKLSNTLLILSLAEKVSMQGTVRIVLPHAAIDQTNMVNAVRTLYAQVSV